jgi:hypothetical protein
MLLAGLGIGTLASEISAASLGMHARGPKEV